MIGGGVDDPLAALRAIRARSAALIVMKRGPMGCVAFPGAIPASIEDGVKGPGFPVEVYNVLGAGDAFMSGFLRGWLRDEPLETACAYANAGGAFAVSRLLCSAEYLTWPEMQRFLQQGSPHRALRHDEALNHIHWATTRRAQPDRIMALAIDHRAQLEKIADDAGAPRERIGAFKLLAVEAAARVARGRPGFGMLIDGKYGRQALFRADELGFWIGRPVEEPGSRPLDFEFGGSLGAKLIEWPLSHTIKCLCFYRADDPDELKARQERELLRLYDAARRTARELLIEIVASKQGPVGDRTVADAIARLYQIGIKPDWWKLEGQTRAAWRAIDAEIDNGDPLCRGVMVLGLEAPEEDLAAAFRDARSSTRVKGFAVGRTIFVEPALRWFAGEGSDEDAVRAMADSFARLCEYWETAGG
jgi:5-dehydro-2-deoxygluconokinase